MSSLPKAGPSLSMGAAGALVDQADFLRNPADPRDFNALPWQNEREDFSDKFVLAFEKP